MTRKELRQLLSNQGGDFPGIYLIKRKSDGKPYVGKARCIINRIDQHIDSPDKSSSGIDADIKRLGWDAFDYEVLEAIPDATDNQLFYREQVRIDSEHGYDIGYNKTRGNWIHTGKVYKEIKKYLDKHVVTLDILRQIPSCLVGGKKTLIHSFSSDYIKALVTLNQLGNSFEIKEINDSLVMTNGKGEYVEDSEALAKFIFETLETMKTNHNINLGDIIANVPYGPNGAKIVKEIVKNFEFTSFYNIEPGNDYFTTEKLYKHIDTSFTPVVLRTGCFKDASQTIVIVKIQKEENKLSEFEARVLLHLDTNNDKPLLTALTEYLWKVHYSVNGALQFTSGHMRRHTAVAYNPDYFTFNSGAYEIIGGALQLANKDKTGWSVSTEYNVLKHDIVTKSDVPSAKVTGCEDFTKMIYSEQGLAFIHVLFGSSPEGWGYRDFFADIDYTGCTLAEYFNRINLSAEAQATIFARISEVELSAKEVEVAKLAAAL